MIFKNTFGYSIIKFNPENYYQIVQKLHDSNIIITSTLHDDSENIHVDKEFNEYLQYKNALYMSEGIKTEKTSSFIFSLNPDQISETIFNNLKKDFIRKDDFSLSTTEEVSHVFGGNVVTKRHNIHLYEEDLLDCAIQVDKAYYDIEKMCLTSTARYSSQERRILLPLRIKHNGKYLLNYVMITIFKEGIISLQICVQDFIEKQLLLSESPPRYNRFHEVTFYKNKEYYSFDDYWEEETFENINIDYILAEYKKRIINLINLDLYSNDDFDSVSWGIGDFSSFKNPYKDISAFYTRYKSNIGQYLFNSDKQLAENNERAEEIQSSRIRNDKDLSFYCSSYSSVFTLRSERMKNLIEMNIEELKTSPYYKDEYKRNAAIHFLVANLNFVKFYEMSFVKKYFLKDLLNQISESKNRTTDDYNRMIKQLNTIKFNYDKDVIFFTDGSPKTLYELILEKSNINDLEDKVVNFLNLFKDDIQIIKDKKKDANELLLLSISSILTIVLGFTGLLTIFKTILGKENPNYILYSIVVWGVLIIIIIILNIRRWVLK
ncbi:hypothetical protein [Lysinibacillus sp. Bpr_S20]|uniref:hypothetical protein n=1 Tax=Lysinibacillus sp. Bpr_S20 TaxID=2933964 RepID=UPI00201264CE|nr:hypothetical protein [Lysinibacillus sp. Bpr_S20]MCL1701641.1 hypothetical protein [Lysinibacillus sp. Bpr_S20]